MPRRKKQEEPMEPLKKIKTPAAIKGMKDVLPSDYKYWRLMIDGCYQLGQDYNFVWVETPLIEKYELYAHTIGKSHPMIKSDLLYFLDRGEKGVLRFDYTPGVARSFVEHSLYNQTGPIKLWYNGHIFAQGRTTDNKYRESEQLGFEVYGEKSAGVDAELIVMLYQTFIQWGLTPKVRISSQGCLACRQEYLKALSVFIKGRRAAICPDCRTAATKDPLQFLKCANQKCVKVVEEAPQVVDYLCETCHNHLFKTLETLDELKVEYVLDGKLINDFGYYNSTIYNIYNKGAEDSAGEVLLATGGRFNYLTEMIGGPNVPAAGIKLVAENVISEMKDKKIEVPRGRAPHVYLAQLSDQAKRRAMSFMDELRQADLRVVANFSKDSLKSQLDTATKLGAKIVLILGLREVVDGTILMRDMDSGIQEVVNIKKVIAEIKKKIRES